MKAILISILMLTLGLPSAFSQTGAAGIQGRFWLDASTLGARVSAQAFFRSNANALGLGANDSLGEFRVKTDSLGFTHCRFQQYYQGVKIDGADCVLHERNGLVEKANGRLVTGINNNMRVFITPQQAIDSAIARMGAQQYMWQDSLEEAEIKIEANDTAATYYPIPELVLIKAFTSNSWAADSFRLTYRIPIHSRIPYDAVAWFVDAQTGRVFRRRSLLPSCGTNNRPCTAATHTHQASCNHQAVGFGTKRFGGNHAKATQGCHQGTGATTFNGTRTIFTTYTNGSYRLFDDCSPAYIWTRYYADPLNNANVTEYTDGNNVWTSNNDQMGVTAHWGIKTSQDYFKAIHNRNGWNGNWQDIKVYCQKNFGDAQNPTYSNASWNQGVNGFLLNGKISFGTGYIGGIQSDDYTSLDVCGHEFAHGVTRSESNLVYERESGALNEGLSDIFGEIIDHWVTGAAPDWRHNERTNLGGNTFWGRDLMYPARAGQPETYGDTLWRNPNCANPNKEDNDYCGVHINSGVLNKAFALMVSGGIGVNFHGDPYDVPALGFIKGRKIVYRAATMYLSSQDEYADAREAFIQSAEDLYGVCSSEAIAVAKAFYAVGVESNSGKYNRKVCGAVIPILGLNQIEATRSITSGGPGCATSFLPNGIYYQYKAGLEVVYKDGFVAPVGSNMKAVTEGCSFTKN
ncbi:MAG: M4 family metallopeptidase [Bacteroidia bacterium]